jgi:hypothetical protein
MIYQVAVAALRSQLELYSRDLKSRRQDFTRGTIKGVELASETTF